MSLTDPFKSLGLKRATATQADVKAAYARLLKVTRPEDDPAAFMALRQAFEAARNVACGKDAVREAAPTPEPAKAAPPPAQIKWKYDTKLNWNFNSSPSGKLVEQTVRWMLAGGADRQVFCAQIAEGLIGLDADQAAAFRAGVTEFIGWHKSFGGWLYDNNIRLASLRDVSAAVALASDVDQQQQDQLGPYRPVHGCGSCHCAVRGACAVAEGDRAEEG